ncbi:MAG: hypothetical protein F6K56_03840 [Moorea sp. SIO3G5]|nr:hypothetical protein [Moorena sp. SIO3G5]
MGQIAILEAFSDLPDARNGQRMLTRAWLYVWLSLPSAVAAGNFGLKRVR